MKLQRLFRSCKNLNSKETWKKHQKKKMVFWSFIFEERTGFLPLKQAFLTLEIQKNSLWPKATLHILILERKGEGDQFTSRKWLPGVFPTAVHNSISTTQWCQAQKTPAALLLSRVFDLDSINTTLILVKNITLALD